MCKDNCKCNKCKNKFLPISGRDVLYYGLPLEIINVEYGENYEEILIKLNKLISEITTDKESSDLFFSNIGNGIGILKGINEFNQVEFKSLISDGSIDIQTDDKTITLKTIYNFKIVEDVNEANTYLSVENEGKLVYIKQTDKYYKIKNLELSDPFPTKLETPTQDGVDGPEYKVPAYLPDGSAYWRSATDFGKVDTVNNIKPDNNRNVTLKISDLEDDKGLALLSDLNNEINNRINNYNELQLSIGTETSNRITQINDVEQKIQTEKTERISEDNILDGKITIEKAERIDADGLKLDKPLENATDQYVILGDGTTSPKSDFGKVKTVNNQEPDENGNIKIKDSEFVKNGEGWSLKYRVDNPSFYGTIGKNAIDLSVATSVNSVMPERFSFGGNAWYTAVFGNSNSAMGTASLVSGGLNRSQGQCNNIISYSSTIIEDKGKENYSKKDNGIYSGNNNIITNTRNSVILGGTTNKITGNENSKNGYYSAGNAIIGGGSNEIFSSPNTNSPASSSFILGGLLNKAQGCYNTIGGYSNHAVTVGETLFGMCGTIQNTSLDGLDFISNSRMFNVGIGSVINGGDVRKDGFSVFRHGLVTAPSLTTSLIEANNKAVTTKEFVDSKISNFKLPTNWESPQQKFSGLLDKSADATYNNLLGVDGNGYVAKVGLPALTNEMSKSTDAQKDAFRLASRKSTENYNTSAPIILIANPFLIKNINNYPVNLVITGNNLFIDKVSSSLQIRRIKDVNGNPISDVWIDVTSSINVSEINNSLLAIYHNFKSFPAGYYEMKLTNQVGLSNLTSPLFMIVDNYEDTPTNAFEVISNSGNLLSQSTIGYNSTETTIISGLNGGMIFKDLVEIVDGNVNSITTIEISHTNPLTDYDMGEIVAGFTDQAIITPTTMPIVGVKAFYKDWAVRCSDVKNNKDLGIYSFLQNNQLNIFKIHLFIKDGTYSILSESHSKVSEGFYTDLSKLNFMLNITRSTSDNRTAPFTVSITSFKKIN